MYMLGSVNTAGNGGGVVAQDTAPTNKRMLWIDTANGGIAKYYDKTKQAWVTVTATWS